MVELAVVIGFIARIDKEIAVDNDDRTLHLADLYSRDDMYTVIIAVNEICKYEYFPSHNWLSLQAIIAESSYVFGTPFSGYFPKIYHGNLFGY